jgi:hypothetical protein
MLSADPDAEVRRCVASESSCAGILLRLSGDPDPRVRRAAAGNCHSTDELRCGLLDDPDPEVARTARLACAFDSKDPDVLLRLSRDPSAKVRLEVADNPYSPEEALCGQFDDPDPDVARAARMKAAENSQDPCIQLRLSKDPSSEVRREVARNCFAADEIIFGMFGDPDPDVARAARMMAAENSCDPEMLRTFSCDPSPQVRCCAACNGHTPQEVLETLLGDPDPEVSGKAKLTKAIAADRQRLLRKRNPPLESGTDTA